MNTDLFWTVAFCLVPVAIGAAVGAVVFGRLRDDGPQLRGTAWLRLVSAALSAVASEAVGLAVSGCFAVVVSLLPRGADNAMGLMLVVIAETTLSVQRQARCSVRDRDGLQPPPAPRRGIMRSKEFLLE